MFAPGCRPSGRTYCDPRPMTAQVLIDAFRLPAQALVGQRIPKKLLVEQGAPTAADKRLINDTVDDRVAAGRVPLVSGNAQLVRVVTTSKGSALFVAHVPFRRANQPQ